MAGEREMRSFWDEKAEDNPLWYVHSGLDYASPDAAEFWASGEREVTAALREAGLGEGRLAVDIGVGAGRLARPLSARFERVFACDVSPRMAAVARENLAGSRVDVVVVPGTGMLPLRAGVADFVLSLQVLQHIPSRASQLTYIREAGRVLRPGGMAVFHVRSCLSRRMWPGSLELAVRALLERMRRVRRPPPKELDSPAWRGARLGLWHIRYAAAVGGLELVTARWISRRGASLLLVCRKRAAT